MSLNSLQSTRSFQSLHVTFCGVRVNRKLSYKYNKSKLEDLKLRVLSSILIKLTFSLLLLKKRKKERDWPANNALLRMTYLQHSFLSRVWFINVSVIRVKYSTSRPSKLTGTSETTRLL